MDLNDSAGDPSGAPGHGLHDFVEAFEVAQLNSGPSNLADFLPPDDHPLFLAVLRELVRVDLEYGWKRGQPLSLDEYQRRFPNLFADPVSVREITYEEYRLRKQAGQNPVPAEYQQRYGIEPRDWPPGAADDSASRAAPGHASQQEHAAGAAALNEAAQAYRDFRLWQEAEGDELTDGSDAAANPAALLFLSLHSTNPDAADCLAQALTRLPAVDSDFLGFHLVGELGHGAFSRVYLARQGDLANRLVALKVTSDLSSEWQTLAQLQHTHIVPIYSVHRASPLQAVCMPYLGATTLADFLGYVARQQTLPASGQCLLSTLEEGLIRLAESRRAAAGEQPAAPPQGAADSSPPAVLARLKQLTYVETVLWLAVRLTDGLAHAHARGILHRDLKPANILLTDDGQPMLLDFNLSANAALRQNPFAACVGGTLPYMAPEHLEAFSGAARAVDARSDLYAIGVILFEMLTGRSPFPRRADTPFSELLERMIADRHELPRVRSLNAAVSPGLEAIVRRCLEPTPARRYQSADELHEDLQRQLDNRPLRHAANASWLERLTKWGRRHPRLSSTSTVGAVALVLLLLLGGAFAWTSHRQSAVQQARQNRAWLRAELRTAQFLLNTQIADPQKRQSGIAACQRIVQHYRILDQPDWLRRPDVSYLSGADQLDVRADMGEVLWLYARALIVQAQDAAPDDDLWCTALRYNRAAEECFPPEAVPAALWLQRAELHRRLRQPEEAAACLRRAAAQAPTPRDLNWQAADLLVAGRDREALTLLRQTTETQPRDFWSWFLRGVCHARLAHDDDAVAAYHVCTALWPDYPWSYYNRGLSRLKQHRYAESLVDFNSALRLQPDEADILLHRALANQGLRKFDAAIEDLTAALRHGAAPVRVYFMRAKVRQAAGDETGAQADRALGFREKPTSELCWLTRGLARLPGDPAAALRDFEQALKVNSRSLPALQNKAHVLSLDPSTLDDAIQTLDQAVELYPDYAPARSGRGVLLARQGKREKALEDAQVALLHDTSPPTLYQVAGIYAQTSNLQPDDRLEALRLLSAALRLGYGHALIESDRDLDPIRVTPEFNRLVKDAQAVQPGAPARQ